MHRAMMVRRFDLFAVIRSKPPETASPSGNRCGNNLAMGP